MLSSGNVGAGQLPPLCFAFYSEGSITPRRDNAGGLRLDLLESWSRRVAMGQERPGILTSINLFLRLGLVVFRNMTLSVGNSPRSTRLCPLARTGHLEQPS
jgi:hypothetical protein